MLGLLLLIIYISDIDNGITSNIGKFADDTNIGRTIRIGEDYRALQEDLNKLSAWTNKWQVSFNNIMCSVLSVGTRNPLQEHSLDSTGIGRQTVKRDLGVFVKSYLKLGKQCISMRNKAVY